MKLHAGHCVPAEHACSSCLPKNETLIFGPPVADRLPWCLRCHVSRDYDPVQGKWYEDLEEKEIFQVLSVDPDEELIEIQYENGDIEEIDLDTWHELDLERTTQPEGWVNEEAPAGDAEEEDEVEDDDEDWDEDEDDDDWDDDDEDLDDDYS